MLTLLTPHWPAPESVGSAMSTREGGVSEPPFDQLNLRPTWPGDDPAANDRPESVAENMARYRRAIGARPVFLRQVHGTRVVNLDEEAADGTLADAAISTQPGVACTVLVADCPPVLLADRFGRGVGAAHAGWRGLSAGVLEATVGALCAATAARPGDLLAWLGPCIGPQAFEVGEEVLSAFGVDPSRLRYSAEPVSPRFVAAPRPDGSPRWRADLAGLAQDRLSALGLGSISPSGLCTVQDRSRFFSFRRDGLTGRLAASVWRRG